jgi:hypothetical protein
MDISVIIVNWNTKTLLSKCLDSVYSTMGNLDFEIIVVDNASTDDSLVMLEERYPQVIRIGNKINMGFGAANNQAFTLIKGKYALLLNTDAVLTPTAVHKLWSFSETHPQAAIVCGQLLHADGSKQNSVAAFPSLLTLTINNSLLEYLFPARFPGKRYERREPLEVDSAIGACMIIRKQAINEVGFFDRRYFFFFEETDLAYALRKAGWKIYQVPDAVVYHLQGQSIGHNFGSRIEFYRARYQFLRKWHGHFFYYSARGLIFLRLLIDWFINLAAVIFSLGLVKNLRQKLAIYSQLIVRHFYKTL